jgi:(1->4)-alpha-D-glucan 1-alpha-D-glucosylmutase
VRATGSRARNVIAFARRHEGAACITVAPRLVSGLGIKPGGLPCGEVWENTRIELPFLEEGAELTDVITGAKHRVEHGGIDLDVLLALAPVAVLTNKLGTDP